MNKYENFFVCVAFVEENWGRISFNNLAMVCNITSGEDQCQAPLGEGREEIHLQRAVATAEVCVISK